ncbi:TonB-dependent receptor [Erythrobacter litoralis]|uniref:TonB-dependent receptor n=1 Tax=Erythrobacter litoralis TaxID=39960 RepID=UPI002435054B|nr:TonB-dependent receptor [Erythrobacter litoralis]MDG6078940.1 TonB-dependent receptor [Erythrobacter litoralis]
MRKVARSYLFVAGSVGAILSATPLYAGEIQGTVTDAGETIALRSAEVRILELDRTAVTERDGSFLFASVPAGIYTLQVRYIGADTVTQTIEVPETGIVRADLSLSGVSSDAEILVIGQSANLSSALSRKRESDTVSDVLTRDAIGQFPDQNVAESLRRLPGINVLNDQGEGRFVSIRGLDPSLNATSLNGVRLPSPESDVRAVALDVISSDIIESIEVKKSLTPDMDADTIGASVEIETTSAFDRKRDLLSVRLEGSYNDYSDELTPKGSVDFSYKVSDNFGVSGGLAYYDRKFETDNVEADGWNVDDDGLAYFEDFEYRDYDVERERISATLGFDFRAGDFTDLYVRGIYSQFDDQEFRRRLIFDFGDAAVSGTREALVFSAAGGDEDEVITIERDVKDRFESQKIRSIVAGGETDTGDWFANYSASWAKSTERETGSIDPASFEHEYEEEDISIGFDVSDLRVPQYSVLSEPGNFFDPTAYSLNDIELTALSDAQDEEYSAVFDFGRRFIGEIGTFTVQTGFKGRWREKGFDGTIEFYENDDVSLADVLGRGPTYHLADISPVPGYGEARDLFEANRGAFELQEFDSTFDSNVEDFTVEEDILAGYLLGRWDSGLLTVIGGVRYEDTSNTLIGNDVLAFEDGGTLDGQVIDEGTILISPVSIEKDYDHWLPSLNIRYEPANNIVLRLAGYRSIVRPGPFQQAPTVAVEESDEGEREAAFGNPELRPTEAWNIDAAAEYYMNNNGAIFASLFYKNVEDFLVETAFEADDAPFNGVFRGVPFDEASIFFNGDEADIFGIELGVAQTFTGALDGFLVQANYTFTDAQGTVTLVASEGPREVALPATSRHTGNISLGYDKGPLDIRLSGTYRDRYLDELGSEPGLDRYVDDHFQLDLAAKYRFTDRVQVFYEWVNINNAKYFAYNNLGGRRNLYQYEEYNWTMKAGVRLTF